MKWSNVVAISVGLYTAATVSSFAVVSPVNQSSRTPIQSPGSLLALAGTSGDDNGEDMVVMVNGMPGPMATAAAEACLRKGLKLAPIGLTGPDVEPATITVATQSKSSNVRLIPSSQMDEFKSSLEGLRTALSSSSDDGKESSTLLLVIDYTHPTAVNGNAKLYVENKLPFVMGTTGGDREQLMKDVEGFSCVIAPNMAKQIVALQAALEIMGQQYPGAFDGYKLTVIESHQKKKADTSGTAKAVVESIKKLASDDSFTFDDIVKLRDDKSSLEFGVPEEGLEGHAFHTYTLTSADESVQFQLKHNVVGRSVYADGSADAVKFLARKIRSEPKPQVYNMIDVLQEGALE